MNIYLWNKYLKRNINKKSLSLVVQVYLEVHFDLYISFVRYYCCLYISNLDVLPNLDNRDVNLKKLYIKYIYKKNLWKLLWYSKIKDACFFPVWYDE